ncbi:MAG: FAD-dependent oxidoreductase [Microthrixaceae bacterium]
MSTSTIAVVGAGLAGAFAAVGARESGFDGRIVLIGDEAELPYERPPLSKDVLRGDKPPSSADVHAESHYAELGVERLPGRSVTTLDPEGPAVVLDDGERIACTAVVLATGAAPRRLAVPGADLSGVHHLRNRSDSLALHDALGPGRRVVVVGAGWIGTEVAASARQMGAEVTVVDPSPVPLRRVLGDTVGAVFAGLHAEHGVDLRLGRGVQAVKGDGTVEAVVLDDGSSVDADLVVAGIGVIPRTDLAERAGLSVANGVVVDEHLRTSVPGILAAGDVASAFHPHYDAHIRVEHWANARGQGAVAGANAAGAEQVYDRIPYFFSDQYDLGMEYVGLSQPDDELTVRGDLATREFIAFRHRDGVLTSAMNVNVWDVVDDLRALIVARTALDPARLADPSVPIAELGPGGA